MSDCTHDYAHRVTDVANGACPFCLADRIRKLEAENAAQKQTINTHSLTIWDLKRQVEEIASLRKLGQENEDLRARVAELEAIIDDIEAMNMTISNYRGRAENAEARVAELEGALRDIVIPSAPLKLDRYTKARAILSSNPSTQR